MRWKRIPGTATHTTFDGHVVMMEMQHEGETVEVDDRLLAELIEAARQVVQLRKRGWFLGELDERVGELERALVALSESVGRQVEAEKKE